MYILGLANLGSNWSNSRLGSSGSTTGSTTGSIAGSDPKPWGQIATNLGNFYIK